MKCEAQPNTTHINLITMDYKDWITQTKKNKPELADFITKLESLITDTGFNTTKFENAVENGLKKVEADINETFNKKDNAQNKENND